MLLIFIFYSYVIIKIIIFIYALVSVLILVIQILKFHTVNSHNISTSNSSMQQHAGYHLQFQQRNRANKTVFIKYYTLTDASTNKTYIKRINVSIHQACTPTLIHNSLTNLTRYQTFQQQNTHMASKIHVHTHH